MDFELDKSQKEIKKAAKDFAKGEFDKELILEFEKNNEYPDKIWKKAADLGFIGMHYDEKYSGGGLGMIDSVLLAEEFSRNDSSLGSALTLSGYGAECILRFGSDELKERFIPKIAEGEILSAVAFKDPNQDPTFKVVNTEALKDGDSWVINGRKNFVLNGGIAGVYIVLCKTGDSTTLIAVEADIVGMTFENIDYKLGINMVKTANITFENVKVSLSNTIGKEGKGTDYVQKFLVQSRILIAAIAVGIAQGAFERGLEYSKGRVQFNKKIALFQASRNKFADMATKIELSRLLTYRAAVNFDKKNNDPHLSAMAKMVASKAALYASQEAIQLLGGYGFMTEYEVERFYRDAKFFQVYEGNNDVLRNDIAGVVMGRVK